MSGQIKKRSQNKGLRLDLEDSVKKDSNIQKSTADRTYKRKPLDADLDQANQVLKQEMLLNDL